jgi:uroporphyrinogen-III decarboxylase
MTNPLGWVMSFSRPDVRQAFEALLEAGKEIEAWRDKVGEVSREALEEGYASIFGGGMAGAPFDNISDVLRSTRGIVIDMYRRPEKIKEAMERLVPIIIKGAIRGANMSLSPVVMMPLHKGDKSFMSGKQFEEFYWPTFRKVLIGMINEGMVPYPFAEGRYGARLEVISDLPAGFVIWSFEDIDMARAKKVLGGRACIAGNVPASVMHAGTPADVKEHCRRLIESCADGGGYILTGAAGMNEGNPDNLRAFMEAAKEYGTH